MSDPTPDSPAAPALDKQIRLRATEAEKGHLDAAARDAGYHTLSDYLRPVLFERHVLVIGDGTTEFKLVPAFAEDEEAREAALRNIEGLLALADNLRGCDAVQVEAFLAELRTALQTSPQGSLDLLPEANEVSAPGTSIPGAQEEEAAGVDASTVDAAPPIATAEAAATAPLPPPPGAQPAVAPLQPTAMPVVQSGPIPMPTEDMDAFVDRRRGELTATGIPPLRAQVEAEAEWRSAMGEPQQVPAQPEATAPQPEAAVPANPAFCPHCGTPNAGTRFCAGCGAQLA